MFASAEPPPAYETYARQLVGRGHGLPLWFPDSGPHEIGDVGYIDEGAFHRIFNILQPVGHHLNDRGVPQGFTPLNPSELRIKSVDNYLPAGQDICAYSVKSKGGKAEVNIAGAPCGGGITYDFHCEGSTYAIAILGDAARRESVENKRAFSNYMLANHTSWYEFAERLGLGVREKDLILVSGWVKTSKWAITAYAGRDRRHGLSISANYGSIAQATIAFSSYTSTSVPIEQRVSCQTGEEKDQCMFLQYFKLRYSTPLRDGLRLNARGSDACKSRLDVGGWNWRRSRSRSPCTREPSRQEPLTNNAADDTTRSCTSFTSRELDPVDEVLEYMLEDPKAKVAIIHSEQLYALFPPGSWPGNLREHLFRRQPEVQIDNGTASIPPTIYNGIFLSTIPFVAPSILFSSEGTSCDDKTEARPTGLLHRSRSAHGTSPPEDGQKAHRPHLLAADPSQNLTPTLRARARSFFGASKPALLVGGVC